MKAKHELFRGTLKLIIGCISLLLSVISPIVFAETANVIKVETKQAKDKTWTFHVTISHPDTGWKDYADGWDVVLPDQSIVKSGSKKDKYTRALWHPHVNEQPFTRSQSGMVIPSDMCEVVVKAHTTVDGWGGKEVKVKLCESSDKISD